MIARAGALGTIRLSGLPARLRRGVTSNVGALVATQLATQLLRFGSNLILTRLLAPEVFGIMLILNSVAFVLIMLTETGTSPFIVRSENGDQPRYLDTLWTVEALRSLLLAIIVALGAPTLAALIGKPEVALPLQVSAIGIAITGCRSIAPFVALRRHKAARNAWVELGGYIVNLALTLALVAWLETYWGLVFGLITGAIVNLLGTYLFYEDSVRRPRLDGAVLRELWVFSRYILASSLTVLVVMQFDKLFVISAFPLREAGFYAIAINLTAGAARFSESYFGKVYMPLVSERLRTEALAPAVFYGPMRFIRPALVFVFAVGTTFSPTFIDVLFPEEYAAVGPLMAVLVIKPMLGMLSLPTGMILISNQMAGTRFVGDCLRLGWIVIASLAGLHFFGLWGLVWAVALTHLLPIIYQYGALLRLGVVDLRHEVVIVGAVLAGAGFGLGLEALFDLVL